MINQTDEPILFTVVRGRSEIFFTQSLSYGHNHLILISAPSRNLSASVPRVWLIRDTLDPGPGKSFDINLGAEYRPTRPLSMSLSFNQSRLRRNDTGLLAFQDNIYSFRATYQFSRFVFARARMDYDTLGSRARGQFLFGYTPNPGTAFYIGYNDDLTRNGFNPFNGQLEPGFRRNGRVFFIKLSYLFRKSFGG
jgi:hypothetical protein